MKGGNNWLELAMLTDMDNSEKDYKEVTLKMPMVKVVDISLRHGMRADASDYQQLMVSKSFDNGVVMGLEVLDNAREGEFMDNAAFFMAYEW